MRENTNPYDLSTVTTYRKELWNRFVKGIKTYRLIEPNDKMIGCIQAHEAIKFITFRERLLTDKMFIFDMLTMKTRTAKFGGISSRCSICQNNQ